MVHSLAYRRTEQIEARLADTRAAILKAARRIIAEGGFQEAQVAAVAAAAGVATGTVYRYFPSKADLMAETLRMICAREIEVVTAIADGDAPPAARFADAVRVFAQRALRGSRLAYANIFEPVAPEVDDARLEIRRELAGVFGKMLKQGIAAGSFARIDPGLGAASVVGALLEGLVGPLAPERRGRDDAQVIHDIVAFCLRAVGAMEEGNVRPLR
jgi:AcrR family transcriptional regulator